MATAFCHYSNCPITRACCSLSDPSSSNNRHLGSIKFSLSSDYLDLRSKPSKAKLRVCLKFASSRIIAPGHIIVIASPRLNGHRITSNLADRKVQILPNVGNISDGKSVAPTPICHWTDFNVQSSVLSAFKRLLKSSERNDQVFLSYEIHVRTIATGSPSRKLDLVKVGREHQPVLVIGREADIEVSSDNTLYHQQPVDQASGKGREPRHQNSEKPRRSSRSSRPSQSACRVTKNGSDGSLLVPRGSVEFLVEALVPKPKSGEVTGSLPENGSLEPVFEKRTTIWVLPRILRYLVIHRCRGSCIDIVPGQRVPFHSDTPSYFARPSSQQLSSLTCRPNTLSDARGVTVQPKGNPWVYTRLTLKQLHASSCQCTWM